MRPSRRGSLMQPAARAGRAIVPRASRAIVPLTLTVAMGLSVPGLASADTEPESISALVADVAEANQRLDDIAARVQTEQESVNKAIVEVQDARDAATAAQQHVDTSKKALADANAAITEAQKRFDTFAAATYVNGPSASLMLARTPDDIISTAVAGQTIALSSENALVGLRRARAEAVNSDSTARAAKLKADQAVKDAQTSQDAAVAALTQAQQNFREQQAEIDRLAAERKEAKRKLAEAQAWAAPAAIQKAAADAAAVPGAAAPAAGIPAGPAPAAAPGEPVPAAAGVPAAAAAPGDRWDGGSSAGGSVPYGTPSQWDLTLPAVPSAFVSGDPIQIINAVLGIAQNSFQTTQQLGKKFLQKLGILKPTDTGITNNGGIPLVYGNQAIEYVIKRAQSQIGVPYSWGGGNAAGPSRGIDEGAGTVGFDCSGLVLYAFAGAGIKLPHYSGSQYNMGRKIPSSQMRRGDVIFYGPDGSQHVAIYLGNNQMIEAPYTGATVRIAPVRTGGMTPFAVRYIEW